MCYIGGMKKKAYVVLSVRDIKKLLAEVKKKTAGSKPVDIACVVIRGIELNNLGGDELQISSYDLCNNKSNIKSTL